MTQAKKQYINPWPSEVPVDDPRYPIWGEIWKCRAPRMAAYSTSYLEHVGIPVSGFSDVDVAQMTKLDTCYLSINQMVEYYHTNVEVRIVNQHDLKPIFERCQDYMFRAARMIREHAVMEYEIPVEDLIKLDEFAAAVYEHAGHEYGHDKEFIRTFVSEGVMAQAMELNATFEAVDRKMKIRRTSKIDERTVYSKYSGNLNEKHRTKEEEKPKYELPERPSVRHIFDNMLGGMDTGSRL